MPTRRSLLETLAIGAGALPIARSLGRGFLPHAHAAEGGGPRRALFVYIANGVPERASGYDDFCKAGATPQSFVLGPMTSSLEKHRKNLVIMDNLEMAGPLDADRNTHYGGTRQLLTGLYPTEANVFKDRSLNISIDQYLGQKVGKLVTPSWPALPPMGVMTNGTSCSHLADGSMVKHNDNPFDVYKKLFDGLMTGSRAATPDAQVLARLARRKSVLDSVAKDVASFQKRLGADDRARAEAQLTALRTMEDRLAAAVKAQQGGGTTTATCSKPTLPATFDHHDQAKVPDMIRMNLSMIQSAFACDLSRFGTLGIYAEDYQGFHCGFDPVNAPQTSWHGLSHNDTRDSHATFIKAENMAFGMLGEFADALAAIPEGSGTMLDNTLIFYGTDIGRGHTVASMQFLTIGGRNLGVDTGKYMFFGKSRKQRDGVYHNRMLVAFLRALGLPDETFGDAPDTGTGPLPGFLRA